MVTRGAAGNRLADEGRTFTEIVAAADTCTSLLSGWASLAVQLFVLQLPSHGNKFVLSIYWPFS